MRAFIVSIMILNILTSCSEEPKPKSDVEQFIELVRTDKYTPDTLPEFSPDAIPVLLEYANDFDEITVFPVNPLSSRGPIGLTVGVCLMWTIEHIRLHYGKYADSYPSFVPELHLKLDLNTPYLNKSQLQEVYDLYFNWWYDNQDKDFEEFRYINPLEESPYGWK